MYSMKQSSTVATVAGALVAPALMAAIAFLAVFGCGATDVPAPPEQIDEAKSIPVDVEVEVKEPLIRVSISGAKSQQGVYSCGLFANEADFNARSNAIESASVPIPSDISESALWEIHSVPSGSYTIAIFHDKNENGKLDRHALGYPTEAYGFSNNARGKFGPPNYEEVRFEFGEDDLEMRVQLK